MPPGASALEKFEIARRYLESGQATTARRLMNEVIVEIRDSGESRDEGTDSIADGLEVLEPYQNAAIRRHLERIVQGPLKDELWHDAAEQARAGRPAGDREQRVWKFFEPDPAPPRTRPVRPALVTPGQLALAVFAGLLFAGAAGTTGWSVVQRADTAATAAFMAALAGLGVAVVTRAEWRFRADRQRAIDQELRGRNFLTELVPAGGFATRVDRLYARYAVQLGPRGDLRAGWLIDVDGPLAGRAGRRLPGDPRRGGRGQVAHPVPGSGAPAAMAAAHDDRPPPATGDAVDRAGRPG